LRREREERGAGHRPPPTAFRRRSDGAHRPSPHRALGDPARGRLRAAVTAGRLFLVPCVLAHESKPADVLPAPVLEQVRRIDSFVVENAKSARAFLSACAHPRPIREIAMSELNEHTPEAAVGALLDPAMRGQDLGLLSEAGVPAVADPGARLVAAAHAAGIRVVPLVGPSSILLALMASGLEGQRFRFHGYLPVPAEARPARLVQIEPQAAPADQDQ